MILRPPPTHPEGEKNQLSKSSKDDQIEVDTFDGKMFLEWDPEATVTLPVQLPFFIEFLKLGYRFEPWVEDCPLEYVSNNAPKKSRCAGFDFSISALWA